MELGVQVDGQVIARAIESLANEKIPTDLLVILRDVAMFDSDPREDKPNLEDADLGAVFTPSIQLEAPRPSPLATSVCRP